MGFLGVKNPPANAGDMDLIPESGRSPGEGNGNPFQYSFLGSPMDRERSLVGYSPWCHEGSDMTEHSCTHTYTCIYIGIKKVKLGLKKLICFSVNTAVIAFQLNKYRLITLFLMADY